MRCCPHSPPGSLHALGASKSLHAVTSLLNWYKMVCMGDLSQGLVLIKKNTSIYFIHEQYGTQVCWLKRYCGFNRELFFFNVCKCPRSPQTLASICRSIDIYGGFRAVAAREKYPGFIFVVAIDGELEILNCWYFGEILPFYKRTNRRYSTETEMSSFWWNFHHWLHWKLSKWQLPVQPVMKISSKWRHFRFSVRDKGGTSAIVTTPRVQTSAQLYTPNTTKMWHSRKSNVRIVGPILPWLQTCLQVTVIPTIMHIKNEMTFENCDSASCWRWGQTP